MIDRAIIIGFLGSNSHLPRTLECLRATRSLPGLTITFSYNSGSQHVASGPARVARTAFGNLLELGVVVGAV